MVTFLKTKTTPGDVLSKSLEPLVISSYSSRKLRNMDYVIRANISGFMVNTKINGLSKMLES